MRPTSLLLPLVALWLGAAPAAGQFSSDIPGVPRANLPLRGSRQGRWVFEAAGLKYGETRDTLVGRAMLGWGQSYRVGNYVELGFDLTFAEGLFSHAPADSAAPRPDPTESPEPANYVHGVFGYGFRTGIKVRPLAYVSPEGNGFALALGAAIQPALKPLWSVVSEKDTTITGGLIGGGDGSAIHSLHAATEFALMASYRAPRVLVDAALVQENVDNTVGSPLEVYSGLSARLGAMYRLTPGFAAGVSWWGSGEPPWRDRVVTGAPAERDRSFALNLAFGAKPESGTDLMITSPTGQFTKSLRLYVRGRSTF